MSHTDVVAKAKQYGLNMRLQKDRLIAAEEVLTGLAQTNPKNSMVQRAIAAIRTWLRENVPSLFRHMEMTDAEIINNYLVPAREFVQRGRKAEAAPGGLAGAFSRHKDAATAKANRLLAALPHNMRDAPDHDTAKAEAEKISGVLIKNLSTGMKASVSKKSAKKMVDNSAVGKSATLGAHYAAVANVDQLFEVAIREGQRPGEKAEDAMNIKAIHRFDAPMPFNGEIWRVRMTVQKFARPEIGEDRIYTLEIVDIEEAPVSYQLPSSPVSHVHDELAHWRKARFAQMAAIVKDGVKPDESDGTPDIRFSRSAATPATGAPAGAAASPFRTRMDKVVDSVIYNFQYRFKPLKDIQKRAGALPEEQDASLAEERYSGTVRARTDDFEAEHRTPLIKAIHDSGVAYEDVEEYLHALHAPSRNKAMHDINPTEAELNSQVEGLTEKRDSLANDVDVQEYVKARRELRLAEADIDDGLADESLGRMLKQEIARLSRMASVRDYLDTVDKLRALRNVKPFVGDNTALSGMSNAEADAILAKAKKQGTEKALAAISAMVDTIPPPKPATSS